MTAAAELSYVNQVMRDTENHFSRNLLEDVRRVTLDQVLEAIKKYMLPVFQPRTATLIVTCAQNMGMGALKDFGEAGFNAKIQTLDQVQD